MKRTTYLLLLAATAVLLLALSACVRPAPGAEELVPPTATSGAILIPTLPLATLPVGGVVDPNLGIASPTPLPIQVIPTVAASPTPLPPAPEPVATAAPVTTGETIHVVAAGENLFRIGLRYGFTAQELATYNNIADVDRIYVGQEIKIPAK